MSLSQRLLKVLFVRSRGRACHCVMLLLLESGCVWTKRGEKAIDPREREEGEGAGSAACNLLIE